MNNFQKIYTKTLIKNNVHLLKFNKQDGPLFTKTNLLLIKPNLYHIKIQKYLNQLKKTLYLTSMIAEKKGIIYSPKKWNAGQISNKTLNKIPNLIILFDNFTNLNGILKEINNAHIITICITNKEHLLPSITFPITINTENSMSKNLLKSFYKEALKHGLSKQIYKFSNKKFPRLDSNQ